MANIIDAALRPGAPQRFDAAPADAGIAGTGQSLAAMFAGLDVEHDHRWAWDNYERTLRHLVRSLAARRVMEIGGGRDPTFSPREIAELGIEMTVNDISAAELAVLPAGYRTACFDVASPLADDVARDAYDLVFSRMVFEHVADGRTAWRNLHAMLAPGGVALSFVPTLYALPFVANWLLPDRLAAAIVRMLYGNRTAEDDPVFPARYSWCFADRRLPAMLNGLGFRDVAVVAFYGHGYYDRFPGLRALHARFTDVARRGDWRALASYAYIAARK